jgi:hypothetical protein
MWPGQRLDEPSDTVGEHASKILQFASPFMQCVLEQSFMVFPVFLAGFASRNPSQQMLAIDLLRSMEMNSIGGNIRATRMLLEQVCEEQKAAIMREGTGLMVDWKVHMERTGMKFLHAGL